jgi:chlorobactene glucosyltransferase
MTWLPYLGLLITFALLIMGITLVSNLFSFPRLRSVSDPEPAPEPLPLVSILIPARNEAAVIAKSVQRLLAQTYPRFELLLLDDNSTDGTGRIAQQAASTDDRFRLISGQPLPAGWLGKNWACHQLAQEARGDLLLFLDADVQCTPDAVAALVTLRAQTQADLLTVWPTQVTVTWAERLVVPLMSLAILAYLPLLPVHHTSLAIFAAANGQCLLFRRAAYQQINGHTAVRDQVVEDVLLARRIKAAGLRLRMADGAGLVSCRMYDGWPAVRDGYAKNLLAGHGNSIPFLAVSTLFHWLIFIGPWIWFAAGGGWWPFLLGLAGMGWRALSAAFTRQRMRDALLMPVSVCLMTLIAGRSIWWRWRGKTQWKGRVLAT